MKHIFGYTAAAALGAVAPSLLSSIVSNTDEILMMQTMMLPDTTYEVKYVVHDGGRREGLVLYDKSELRENSLHPSLSFLHQDGNWTGYLPTRNIGESTLAKFATIDRLDQILEQCRDKQVQE